VEELALGGDVLNAWFSRGLGAGSLGAGDSVAAHDLA
jgi:hypothetical protein